MVEQKPQRRAHFNEEEISEYDKQRGQCMKIDDPKTPWEHYDEEHDASADVEMSHEQQEEYDPVVEGNLEMARLNREKNMMSQALKQFTETKEAGKDKGKAINIGQLLGKLNQAKDE